MIGGKRRKHSASYPLKFMLNDFIHSVTPVINIVQTFLNEKDLYNAVVELPKTMEFIGLITKLATNPKFKYIECKLK